VAGFPGAFPSSTYSRLADTNARRPCPLNALVPTMGLPTGEVSTGEVPAADTFASATAPADDPPPAHAATPRATTANAATEAASLGIMPLRRRLRHRGCRPPRKYGAKEIGKVKHGQRLSFL
jgi:hypothetical protein